METKYKTVEELLENPKRWTQLSTARDAEGTNVCYLSNRATSWCLWGAMRKVLSGADQETANKAVRELTGCGAVHFNDNHNHEEVMALVRAAKI